MSLSGVRKFLNDVRRNHAKQKAHTKYYYIEHNNEIEVTVMTGTGQVTYAERMSKKEFMIRRLSGEYDDIEKIQCPIKHKNNKN